MQRIRLLEKLEFINISFDNLDQEALNSLCSLKNLKELKLERCRFPNSNVDLLRLWGKSLSNLRVIYCIFIVDLLYVYRVFDANNT